MSVSDRLDLKMPVVQNELVISWIIAWQKAIRTQAGLELSDFVKIKIKNAPTPTDRRENISDTMTMSYCITIC